MVDHFHTVPTPSQEVTFECWMSLAAIARDTKRIRVGQIVTCNGYRNPVLLAKWQVLSTCSSHGRLNLASARAGTNMSIKRTAIPIPMHRAPAPAARSTPGIRAMWEQEEAYFEGTYYQIRGAINQPKGVQKPHIPIVIGGRR